MTDLDNVTWEPSEREERFKKALFNHQIDPTGALLLPGYPEKCEGNGKHPDYECCCDECDYLALCTDESSTNVLKYQHKKAPQ